MRTSFWKAALAAALLMIPGAAMAQEETYNHVKLFETNFDDGTLQGWGGRGRPGKMETLTLVPGIAHTGPASLKISDRVATWMGPIRPLAENIAPEDTFRISGWVYYDEGPANAAFTLSVERFFKDPKAGHKYNNIGNVQAKKGEWTPFTVEYTVGSDPTQAGLLFYVERPYKSDDQLTPEDKISFSIDDVVALKLDPASRPKIQDDIPNLAEIWADRFTVGAAVSPDEVDPANALGQLTMKHFTALVAGNTMKWDALQPKEGQFQWAEADKMVEFGSLTGMAIRGHTLVWHQQTPAWVFQDPKDPTKPVSKELLLQRMKAHIKTVMEHYKGQVGSWDVVNEAVSDKAGLRTGAEGSRWYEILGPSFIDEAFKAAKAADPDAQLVYNDYNLESDARKRADTVKLIKGLKERGVPIDAVGLQMHISIGYPTIDEIKKTIAEFAALGVKVIVTELDVSIYSSASEPKKEPKADILLAQAQRYKDLFAVFADAAKKGWLDTVVVWGLVDSGSWLNDFPVKGRADAPLFFDKRYQAKPAFWALVDPTKVKGLK